MFDDLTIMPTLPVKNIERAKKFYSEKLGLKAEEELPTGVVVFKVNKSSLLLYTSQYAGTAQNTAATFETNNLDRDMSELRNKGVVFEDYDMGDLKTVNGVASTGDIKSAWFKDTEGNIIALTQRGHR
jgi:catechol 2,3-dioxygenase-like lactoylglutathione lyase family enzyme